MNTYREMCSFDNLYKAHQSAKRGKRYKDEIIEFELESYRKLEELRQELLSGMYRISPYRSFVIHDPKERHIYAPAYRDRVMQHCLCDNIIGPVLERRLIYDNAASRVDKGTHFAMDRLTGFMRDYYRKHGNDGYILKCDIAGYFDNIDHQTLYRLLVKVGQFDNNTLWLISKILGSYHTKEGKGLPLGNQSSQWFALYYLDGLDRLVKEKLQIKYYTRYMDDCVIIHHDREYLKHCLAVMTDFIRRERQVEFNRKTEMVPMSQGVDYLGFRFYLTDTGKVIRRLRTSNKKRFKRRLKHFMKAYARGEIEIDVISRSLASYKGHLKHGHTYKLREKMFKEFKI